LPKERQIDITRRVRAGMNMCSVPRCIIYTAEPALSED
jgi:hypothetical protein